MKLYIEPRFAGPDDGRGGGIRRVIEAQERWLPEHGITIVDNLFDADIVATHAGSAPAVPTNMPWVVHCHGLYWSDYKWAKWAEDLNRRVIDAMRRADHVTAPSEWVAYALQRGMWLNPTVLPHGIEPEMWEGGGDGEYILWNKSRVDPICDPRPVNELASRAPDLKFITTYGRQEKNVDVTGLLSFEAARELVLYAGVLLCTTRETFGIGTLEAMAAGVPVVGWRWGGQAEFIKHGETGWLVNPGDYDGLLEGIQWAKANRAEIGKAAQADVLERFTWEKAMASYAEVYKAVRLKKEIYYGHGDGDRPTVSVIIPCYNLGRYLPQCIASLQAQTLQNWEAVIVNDASTDDSAKIARSLVAEDSRVRLITNLRNLYLAGALNAGIEQARARYIIPLDADNMLAPDTLSVLSRALDESRGVHIAYGACKFVLEDGESPDTDIALDGVSRWPTDFRFRNQMLHRNQVPSTAMYRREVWERIGGYRRRCRTAEDAEFWTRACSYGFIPRKVTGGVTLIYRQRTDSMSRVEPDWDWTAWLPWTRRMALTPWGAATDPPQNFGLAWPVPSCEPPKIAVIIPVGPEHEEMVIDSLDSVEGQTFRAWECIVINDTGKALTVPHPWARVLTTDGGAGPAKARNIGIEASRAPLFLPLDADDYLQPGALDEMYALWQEARGVVYSQWWDDKGDKTDLYDPPDYDANLLIQKGCIHTITALYPKGAWQEIGGFDEQITNWEDWDFQLALASRGICGTKIAKPLFTYRKTTGFRREENQSHFQRGKEAILAKWAPFWEGKETLMACRGCPGGGGGQARPPVAPAAATVPHNGPRAGVVLLEYVSNQRGTRTFRGKFTGTLYRFGTDPSHRKLYVFDADVESLLEMAAFRKVPMVAENGDREQAPVPHLEAQGPPVQTDTVVNKSTTVVEADLNLATVSKEELALAMTREREGQNRPEVIGALKEAFSSKDRPATMAAETSELATRKQPASKRPKK